MTDQTPEAIARVSRHSKALLDGRDKWSSWRLIASQARNFVRGRQWDAADLAALTAAGRHALTLNIMSRSIRALSGMQRQNRRDVKCVALKDGDSSVAAMRTAICRHTMQLRGDQGQRAISTMFDNALNTGKGWLHYDRDYDADPFSGDICIQSPASLMVTEDPDTREYDLSDCKWVDVARWIDCELLAAQYPAMKDYVRGGEDGDSDFAAFSGGTSGDWVSDDYPAIDDTRTPELHRFLLHTTYYREPATIIALKDKQESIVVKFFADVKASREDAAKKLFMSSEDVLAQIPPDVAGGDQGRLKRICKWLADAMPQRFEYAERLTTRINREVWCGAQELDHTVDFMHGRNVYPLSRFCPYFDDGLVSGVAEMLVDAQREMNKRRSQALNILDQTANGGWIIKRASNVAKKRLLELWGSVTGIVIEEDDYGGKVEKILPTPLPAALLEIADKSPVDMEYILGVNSAVLGQDKSGESGVLNAQRQRQGAMVLAPIMDNLDQAVNLFFECLVETLATSGVYSDDEIQHLLDDQDLIDPDVMDEAMRQVEQFAGEAAPQAGVALPQQADPVSMSMLRPEQAGALQQMDMMRQQQYQQAIQPMVRKLAIDMMMEKLGNWYTGRYGVVVNESAESPNQRAEYAAELESMADAGVPIPPKVRIDMSSLPKWAKQAIIKELGEAQMQARQPKQGARSNG